MSDCCCFACIRTQEVGIVEDLGEYKKILGPGLHCILWPVQSVVARLSLRIQQLDVFCGTKTKDNVFVNVGKTNFNCRPLNLVCGNVMPTEFSSFRFVLRYPLLQPFPCNTGCW